MYSITPYNCLWTTELTNCSRLVFQPIMVNKDDSQSMTLILPHGKNMKAALNPQNGKIIPHSQKLPLLHEVDK